jgi:hypothetical protein
MEFRIAKLSDGHPAEDWRLEEKDEPESTSRQATDWLFSAMPQRHFITFFILFPSCLRL